MVYLKASLVQKSASEIPKHKVPMYQRAKLRVINLALKFQLIKITVKAS